MVAQTKAEIMTHIPQVSYHNSPQTTQQSHHASPVPGATATTLNGINGDINHVKRPMNAFMVSSFETCIFVIFNRICLKFKRTFIDFFV